MLNLKGFYGRIKRTFSEVIAVFMQPQKNPSSNVFDGGGSEALFERSKPRGFEAFMQRFTGIMVFLWIVDAIVLSILSSK